MVCLFVCLFVFPEEDLCLKTLQFVVVVVVVCLFLYPCQSPFGECVFLVLYRRDRQG